MIRSFVNRGTEDIFHGKNTAAAGKVCPAGLHKIAGRKLDQINAASTLADLRSPPGNHLEALKKSREGQHSIRVNDQYRVCFSFRDGDAHHVEIVDYH